MTIRHHHHFLVKMTSAAVAVLMVIGPSSGVVESSEKPNLTAPAPKLTTDEDKPISINLSSPKNPDDSTYTVTKNPTSGLLVPSEKKNEFIYTPFINFNGTDQFTYEVKNLDQKAEATVQILVLPVNDPPRADHYMVSTENVGPVHLTLSGYDPEKSPLIFNVTNPPKNGILSGTAPHLTYTPNSPNWQSDQFNFKVSDGALESRPAVVNIISGKQVSGAQKQADALEGAESREKSEGPEIKIQGATSVQAGEKFELMLSAISRNPILKFEIFDTNIPRSEIEFSVQDQNNSEGKFSWKAQLSSEDSYYVTFLADDGQATTKKVDLHVTYAMPSEDEGREKPKSSDTNSLQSFGESTGKAAQTQTYNSGANSGANLSGYFFGPYGAGLSYGGGNSGGGNGNNPPPAPLQQNLAPVVNAGVDQSITAPTNSVTLNGSVSDDGLPQGVIELEWTKVSGPGSAVFSNGRSLNPQVTFDRLGTYVLRLTASDTALSASDEVIVAFQGQCNQASDCAVLACRTAACDAVSHSCEYTNLADQTSCGDGSVCNGDEICVNGNCESGTPLVCSDGDMCNGIESCDPVNGCQAATPLNCDDSILCTEDSCDMATGCVHLTNDAMCQFGQTCNSQRGCVWNEYALHTTSQNGTISKNPDQTTYTHGTQVSLTAVPDADYHFVRWEGDLTGTLNPDVISMTGERSVTAVFAINNRAPQVSAGADQFLDYPINQTNLNGTVSDDGLPNGTLIRNWEKISGPGNVDFGDPSAEDTSASFSATGTYVLRLSATDSELSALDEVTIVVNPENTFTILASASAGGSIDPSGSIQVVQGSDQSFSIMPDLGYDIRDVLVDGFSIGSVSSYVFHAISTNHTIHADFVLSQCSDGIDNDGDGLIDYPIDPGCQNAGGSESDNTARSSTYGYTWSRTNLDPAALIVNDNPNNPNAYKWALVNPAMSNLVQVYWLDHLYNQYQLQNGETRVQAWIRNAPVAAAQAKQVADLMPAGHKAMMTFWMHRVLWAGHQNSVRSPVAEDYLLNPDGTRSNVFTPWMDYGANLSRQQFQAFFDAYKQLNGALDVFVTDYEESGFDTSSNWYALLENDARFNADFAQILGASPGEGTQQFHQIVNCMQDFAPNTVNENPVDLFPYSDASGCTAVPGRVWWWDSRESPLFNAVTTNLRGRYFRSAVYDVIRQPNLYPNVKASDYGDSYIDQHRFNIPDYNNHRYDLIGDGPGCSLPICQGEYQWYTGTHQAPNNYGRMGQITWPAQRPFGGVSYPQTPFNSFRYDVNETQAIKLSSNLPVHPWLAWKSFSGDWPFTPIAMANTDYFEESILHMALSKMDNFLLWNPFATQNENLIISKTLKEFDQVAGFEGSQTLLRDLSSWTAGYLLTGMSAGGRKVWRVTLDLPNPTYLSRSILREDSQAVELQSNGTRIVFPEGRIFRPANAVSQVGYWVVQPASAADPSAEPIPDAPVVNAGDNQFVTLPQNSFSLAGSASDAQPLTIHWFDMFRPTNRGGMSFGNSSQLNTTVTFERAGYNSFTHTVRLVADDGTYFTFDDVQLEVRAQVPIANAGTDRQITLPQNTSSTDVILNGSASSDDRSIVSYQWKCDSGTNCPDPQDVMSPTVRLSAGTYTFSLRVQDDDYASSASDTVQITVVPFNAIPVANAGADQELAIAFGQSSIDVTLDGSASSDADGVITDYNWTGTPDPVNSVRPVVTLTEGIYDFQLIVTDDRNAISQPDTVRVTIHPAPVNQPPTVNVGRDRAITLPTNQIALTATVDDDHLPTNTVNLLWSESSGRGGEVQFSNPNEMSTTVTFLATGDFVIRLNADDTDLSGFDELNVRVNPEGTPECTDRIDNDNDGVIDYPSDPGCTDPNDDEVGEENNRVRNYTYAVDEPCAQQDPNNPTICLQRNHSLDSVIYMHSIGATNGRGSDDPVIAAQKSLEMPEGHRVLWDWGRLPNYIWNNPQDDTVDPVTGQHFRSVWWEHGAQSVRAWYDDFFRRFRDAGGQIDTLVLDFEGHYMNNFEIGTNLNDSSQGAHWRALQSDPRFIDSAYGNLAAELGFTDLNTVYNYSSGTNYLVWNAEILDQLQNYIDYASIDAVRTYFPDVKMSNWDYNHYNENYGKWVDGWGHNITFHGTGTHVGTHQGYSIYGIDFKIACYDPATHGRDLYRCWNGPFYDSTPFNSFKYEANGVRLMKLASDTPMHVWIPYRNWGGMYHRSDLYQESIYHAALAGTDRFIFWNAQPYNRNQNPNNYSTPESEILADQLMKELDKVVGYSDKATLVDRNGADNTYEHLASWGDNYLLTGMIAGNRKVWRFTPDSQDESSLSSFLVRENDQEVVFRVNRSLITIPQGSMLLLTAPLSDKGFWIVQPASAQNPIIETVDSAPVVNAGIDQILDWNSSNSSIALQANLTQGSGSVTWLKAYGPGAVTFSDPNSLQTNASFSMPGHYFLRVKVDDGTMISFDDVRISANRPPVANAGADLTYELPQNATDMIVALDGSASYDPQGRYPAGSVWTYEWSGENGAPNPNDVVRPELTLSEGTYQFSLRVRDYEYSWSTPDTVTIQVVPFGTNHSTPVANAGFDATYELAANQSVMDVVLDGSASYDPHNQEIIYYQWTPVTAGSPDPEDYMQTTVSLGEGVHTFSLIVENATFAQSLPDEVTITVNAPADHFTINAQAGPGGQISPSGTTQVNRGADQIYTIQPSVGYDVLSVLVDGIPQPRPVGSYEFTQVAANHSIVASFVQANHRPVVDAGPNRVIQMPSGSTLNFDVPFSAQSVTDDGLPNSQLTRRWSIISKPLHGGARFMSGQDSDATTIRFEGSPENLAGVYVLRLTADDSQLKAYDEIVMTMNAPVGNQAPVVNAGQDQTIITTSYPFTLQLNGSILDPDGLQGPVRPLWSKISGNGKVSFEDVFSPVTTATFTQPDIYTLRLYGNDTSGANAGLFSYDEVKIVIRQSDDECSDGIDNDLDGAYDSNDFSCMLNGFREDSHLAQCQDRQDDDNDGFVDLDGDGNTSNAEPGCGSFQDDDEEVDTCTDGLDNDEDGWADNEDLDCSCGRAHCEEAWFGLTECSDGMDNDHNGLIDRNDPGCTSASDDSELVKEGNPACSDGVDNDNDGLIDFPNDPGCSSIAGAAEDSESRTHNFSFTVGNAANNFVNQGDFLKELNWSHNGVTKRIIWDEATRFNEPGFYSSSYAVVYFHGESASSNVWSYTLQNGTEVNVPVVMRCDACPPVGQPPLFTLGYQLVSQESDRATLNVAVRNDNRIPDIYRAIRVTDDIRFYGDTMFATVTVTNLLNENLTNVQVKFNLGGLMIGDYVPDDYVNQPNEQRRRKIIVNINDPSQGTHLSRFQSGYAGRIDLDYNSAAGAHWSNYPSIGNFAPLTAMWGPAEYSVPGDGHAEGGIALGAQFVSQVDTSEDVGFQEIPSNAHSPNLNARIITALRPNESKSYVIAYHVADLNDFHRTNVPPQDEYNLDAVFSPYKRWYDHEFGNVPEYCPDSTFGTTVGSNTGRFSGVYSNGIPYNQFSPNEEANRYYEGSTLENTLGTSWANNMAQYNLKHFGIWATAMWPGSMTWDNCEGNCSFNPEISLIDPNIDASRDPSRIHDFVDAYHNTPANPGQVDLFWFARPCARIYGADVDYNESDGTYQFNKGTWSGYSNVDLRNIANRDHAFNNLNHFVSQGVGGFYFDAMGCPGDTEFLNYAKRKFASNPGINLFIAKEGAVDRDAVKWPQIPLIKSWDLDPTSFTEHSMLINYLTPNATYYGGHINNTLDNAEFLSVLNRGYQAVIAGWLYGNPAGNNLCQFLTPAHQNQHDRWVQYGQAMSCTEPEPVAGC